MRQGYGALRLEFGSHGWDFGLKAGILASRLGFRSQGFWAQGWDFGLKAWIWASRLGFGLKGTIRGSNVKFMTISK